MKKHILCALLIVCVVCLLTACGCEHEWLNATCTTPLTCAKCGETVGTAQGHNWKEADCEEAKTCLTCGIVEGEAAGHTWVDATCTAAKYCSVCKVSEGKAAGHAWGKATCTEPRTCSRCKVTEGKPAEHKWTSINDPEPQSCTVCGVLRSDLIKYPEHQALAQEAADLLLEPLLRDETSITLTQAYGGYLRDEDTGAKTDKIMIILEVSGKNSLNTKPTEYVFAWYNDAGYLSYLVTPEKKPDMYTGEFVLEYKPELPEIDD